MAAYQCIEEEKEYGEQFSSSSGGGDELTDQRHMKESTILANNDNTEVVFTNYSLVDILNQSMRCLVDVQRIQDMLSMRGIDGKNTYKAFHPLIRLKGNLTKMHISKLTKYMRFVYLNPIEGVLISYKTANKFPH